jgi:hypothetical protein
VLRRETLPSDNAPFAKLIRIAKNNRSSIERPALSQVNAVDPQRYRMIRKLTPADGAKLAEE